MFPIPWLHNFFPWAAQDLIWWAKTWFLFHFSSDTEPRPDSKVEGPSFKIYSISYQPKTSRNRRGPDKTYIFLSKMESSNQRPFPLERKIISSIGPKTNKYNCKYRSFVHFLRGTCFTNSGISFFSILDILDLQYSIQLQVFRSWANTSHFARKFYVFSDPPPLLQVLGR